MMEPTWLWVAPDARDPETAAAEGFHEESALIISVDNNGNQTVAIPFGEVNSVWF